MEGYLSVMDGDPLKEVIKAVTEQFKSHVEPKISSFQKGIRSDDILHSSCAVFFWFTVKLVFMIL